MVWAGECPSFDAAGAEVGGEFRGETVEGEDAAGVHIFHMAKEVVVARMVGKGKGGVAAEAVDCTWVQRPTGDGRDSAFFHSRHGAASGGRRRAEEDMARGFGGVPFSEFGEGDSLLAVDRDEFRDRAVEHDREARAAQGGKDFLGFSQRVAEQDRDGVFLEGFDAEFEDLGHDFLKRREDIAREAVGGFHHQGLGLAMGGGFRAGALAEFEVAGVEERAVVCFDKGLRGAEDMAGGKEAEAEVFEVAGFAKGERDFLALPIAHAGLHEAEGGGSRDGFFVAAGVVAVGVGDEGERLEEARVEPQIRLRQMERPVVPDLDHGASERVL